MGKLRRFEIALINPQQVYFPGQTIQGQVIVELNEGMKMRGVRIKCRGKGHVAWSEGSGDNRRHYSASEDYIDFVLVLLGDVHQRNDMTLEAGNHVLPFHFVLPVGVPGSFEGKSNCYVRYSLKACIDRPWKFDPEYKMLFSVASVLDLNTVQDAMAPAQGTEAKTVCCCCCESGPITATMRIDRSGYVPGENVWLNAEIDDKTGRGVHKSRVKLIMETTYRTHGGSTKREKTICAQLEHGAISPGGSDVWNEGFQIPPLPPSLLPGCNIIEIEYFIDFSIDVIDTPFDLKIAFNIVIGSIPLHSVVQQYMPQIPPGTITNQPQPHGAPVGFDMPPPSYQECVLGKVDTTDDDDKNAGGNMSYAPSYTYYDWLSHPSATAPTAPPSQPPGSM